MNIKFEKHKLKLALRKDGKEYIFKTKKKNDYGEYLDEYEEDEKVICGIYHENRGYVSKTTNDATKINTKKQPMILCDYEASQKIKQNDEVEIEGKRYVVIEIDNISNLDIYADISLEVIQ